MKINSRYKNLNINLDNDNLIDQMEIESIDEMFNLLSSKDVGLFELISFYIIHFIIFQKDIKF